ncbi:hypothetical protein EGT67_13115 [Prescottella agglutinans]|uniref:Uncharacterized protein n=2 Tax=Prescottella agglutinans TaxID=1644129 RepID=A0A438BDL6_9NOCA|nr:hypothetical protein EGT67_13115 [Prescottella agglutinans]
MLSVAGYLGFGFDGCHQQRVGLAAGCEGRQGMTYMGKPYYPAWLDNLADDVTGEGAAWDGAIEGAEAVHEVVLAAREIYEFQDFHYADPCGENSFLEDYTSAVRGVPLYVIVLVTFDAAGKAQRLVVNHRPRSAVLLLSRAMLERFAGTPLAKHWEGTP